MVSKIFKAQFDCLGKNKEKYITLLVPLEKEIKICDKKSGEIFQKNSLKIKIY